MEKNSFNEMLGIEYPIIVAPMFLISNVAMVIAALEAGATAALPALNYRTDSDLREAILEIRRKSDKPFGVNLIVNKSNPHYKSQLQTLCALKVSYIITSLGSPEEVINACKPLGIKVFCDVVNLEFARKAEALGADALIAVNNAAGGHCGSQMKEQLIPELVAHCHIPIISAGGVGHGKHIQEALDLGAQAVSVGTIFIASKEATVSEAYQQALIRYEAHDIVLTSKLSGTHLTVINTPYVQQIGIKAGFLERILLKNKWLKKYIKLLIALRGMKMIEKAAFSATYKTVWCAGPSIEYIHEIRPLKEILDGLVKEWHTGQ